MKNKKKIAVASLAASIVSLIPLVITPDSLNVIIVLIVIGIIFAILGIVLGFISKSDAKGIAITSIVIGIVSCAILCFSMIGMIGIKKVKNCVDNGNGTATCDFLGEELEVPSNYLTEEQMKKGE